MKMKLQFSDYLTIAGIIIGFIATCFTNEIRKLIMEKWQIITLIILANALVIKIVQIWIRNKIDEIKVLSDKILSLDKANDSMHDNNREIADLYDLVNRRQIKYLFSILKNTPSFRLPKKDEFLTDYEMKLFDKLSDERKKKIDEAINDFKKT